MPESSSFFATLNNNESLFPPTQMDNSFSSDSDSCSSPEFDYLGELDADLGGDLENRTYTQLTPAIDPNPDSLFDNNGELSCFPEIDLDGENRGRWECRHPEAWQCDEILDFIFYIVQKRNLDPASVRAENFNRLTGQQLCQMSEEQFQQFEPSYGHLIHESLQKILENAGQIMPPTGYQEQHTQPQTVPSYRQQAVHPCMPLGTYPSIGQLMENDSEKKIANADTGGINQVPMTANSCMQALPPGPPRNKKTGTRGRPRKNRLLSTSSSVSEYQISHRGRKQGQVSKNNHLWEFIRDMLKNHEHNPEFIKWEDREEGVFKFVQSVQVAKLWGKKKNNPNMTYEKLSRAMRFCRTAGYFDELPKNGRYPKKTLLQIRFEGHRVAGLVTNLTTLDITTKEAFWIV